MLALPDPVFVDLGTNQLVSAGLAASLKAAAAAGAPLPSVSPLVSLGSIKRGSLLILPVQFLLNGIVTDLGVGAAGTLGFKPSGQFQNSSYACASLAWVKTGTGTSSVYTFVTVSFINAVMNALFNSGNDPTLDAASVVLGGEIKWADTNGTHETQTFN